MAEHAPRLRRMGITSSLAFGFALVSVGVLARSLAAQDAPERPRVGLVLSGGGARGFAHLGVLKVLDELKVPVDFVAGTSMGAVVGGLFAQGMTYAELASAFRSENWVEMFHDDPPRRDLPMRRKIEDREIPLRLEIGLGRDGIRLPPSLISGAKLMNALRAYTERSEGVEAFDDLPIPFRAVATDVEDGSMVVLDRGALADAIRASMSVPAAFAPRVIGGRTLVDGGLSRNIPIDVARDMGADVLIVSDVSTSLDESPEADDPLSVASRLITTVTWGSSVAQVATLTARDVSLRPDLEGIGSADFGKLDAALAAGEAAARTAADRLSALSVSDEDYRELTRVRQAMLPTRTLLRPTQVRVDVGRTTLNPRVVTSFLRVHPGDSLTLPELRDDLTLALGYGGFQSVEFRILDEAGTGEVIEIQPADKGWGPVVMRAGLSLRDQQRGAGGWSLRARLGSVRLTSRGGEGWGEVEVGTRHGLRAWGYLPLGYSETWFVHAEASIGRREAFPIDLASLPLEVDIVDRQASVGLGVRLGTWGEAALGLTAGLFDVELPTGTDAGPNRSRNEERSFSLRLEGDRMDRVDFPSSGHRLRLGYRRAGTALGGTQPFEHLQLEGKVARSRGHNSLALDLLASSGLGSEVPLPRAPSLGGIRRITLASPDGLWGGYAGMARGTWTYRVGAPASDPARSGFRLGLSAEGGQAWSAPEDVVLSLDAIRWGGSVWVGMDTPLGAILVAVGILEGRHVGWVFQLGSGH